MGRWMKRLEEMRRAQSVAPVPTPPLLDEPPSTEDNWRVAAFRERIPATGPIRIPKLRNSPLTDAQGYCSLCGDALTHDSPARRCRPCVRALWLVCFGPSELLTRPGVGDERDEPHGHSWEKAS